MARLSRRQLLAAAAATVASPVASRMARADAYPSRSITLLVGYAAAGPTDVCGRLIGQWLSQRLGQQVVVENRPGAGSNIATEALTRASPDGYTLLLSTSSNAYNATLYKHLNFDFIRDTVPVAGIMQAPTVLEVHPSLPVNSVAEFIAYAKAHPGKVNMGTAGNGSPPHMFGELFMNMAGVDLAVVGYRGGGPALVDLLSGQIQVMFEGITSSIGHVKAGKLRALGVTSPKRSPALPDVPAIGETVPGFSAMGWFGITAPKGTPQPIVDRLSAEVAAGVRDPAMKAKFADLGAEPMSMGQAEYGKLMADETEKWGKLIRAAHITMQ
jgi:tripartite-type tricarboxylate transporter receptor subunit TctC